MRIFGTICASIVLASAANATQKPPCVPVAKAKAYAETLTDAFLPRPGAPAWTEATPAQLVWAMGVYVGNPSEPADVMPAGDGALVLHRPGLPGSAVLWTTKGKLACEGFMRLNPKKTAILDRLLTVKTLSDLDAGGDKDEDSL